MKKVARFFLLLLLVLLGACYFAMRPLCEALLQQVLQQDVTIESVAVHPLAGILTLSGVQLSADVHWQQLHVDIDIADLLSHRLTLRRLRLDSPQVLIQHDKDGFHLASLPLPAPKTSSPSSSSSSPWQIDLQRLELHYAQLHITDDSGSQLLGYLPWLNIQQRHDGYHVHSRFQLAGAWHEIALQNVQLKGALNGVLKVNEQWQIEHSQLSLDVQQLNVSLANQQLQLQALRWSVDGDWQDLFPPRLQHQWHIDGLRLASGSTNLRLAQAEWQGVSKQQRDFSTLLLDGHLALDDMHWQQADKNDVTLQQLQWQGRLQRTAAQAGELQGELTLQALQAQLTDQRLQLASLHWQGALNATYQQEALALQGNHRLEIEALKTTQAVVSLAAAHWLGQWKFEQNKQYSTLSLADDTRLHVQQLAQQQVGTVASVDWSGGLDGHWCALDDDHRCRTKTHFDGELDVQNWQLHQQDNDLRLRAIRWQTQGVLAHHEITLALDGTVRGMYWRSASQQILKLADIHWDKLSLQADWEHSQGKVSLQQLTFADLQWNAADNQQLSVANTRLHQLAMQADWGHAQGKLSLQQLAFGDVQWQQQEQRVKVDDIQLNGMQAEGLWQAKQQLELRLKDFNLQKSHWQKAAENMLALAQLSASALHIQWQSEQAAKIALASLHGEGLDVQMNRAANNSKAGFAVNHISKPEQPSSSSSDAIHWQLGELSLDGDNRIFFRDHQMNPVEEWKIHALRLRMAEWSSQQSTTTPLQLSAKIKPKAELQLSAKLGGMSTAGLPNIRDVSLQVNDMDAATLSAYVKKLSGYAFKRGTISATFKGDLKQQQLDSMLALKLDQLRLAAEDQGVVDSLQQLVGLSPDAALDTLRDSHDRISLDIPIVGDISQPDFQLDKVIRQALAGSMQKAAVMYLQYAFQPYSTVLGAAMWVGEKMRAIRLPLLHFPPAKNTAKDAQHDEILNKAAKLLKEKDNTSLAVCGMAASVDTYTQVQQEKNVEANAKSQPINLQTLAKERAEFIIQRLQREWHVPSGRLQRCLPQVKDDGESAVQLLF